MSIYLDHNATSPMHAAVIGAIRFCTHGPGGPQGALVVGRKPREVSISGGDQEHKRRDGIENVAGIVGPGKSAQHARLEIEQRQLHLEALRDPFETRLSQIPGSIVFGRQADSLPAAIPRAAV